MLPLVERWEGEVRPDYFQFYATIGDAEWRSDQVPRDCLADLLWAHEGFIYVGCPKQWGVTVVSLERHDTEPPHLPAAQHIAEVSVDGGGPFQLHHWGDIAKDAVISVPHGPHRLRLTWSGFREPFDDLDPDGPGSATLQLWPAATAEAAVALPWL